MSLFDMLMARAVTPVVIFCTAEESYGVAMPPIVMDIFKMLDTNCKQSGEDKLMACIQFSGDFLTQINEIESCDCDNPKCEYKTEVEILKAFVNRNQGKWAFIAERLLLPQGIIAHQETAKLLDEGFNLLDAIAVTKAMNGF